MMEPNSSPLDPASFAPLVVRAVYDIDARDEPDHQALLCDLLSAAWGSALAQNQ